MHEKMKIIFKMNEKDIDLASSLDIDDDEIPTIQVTSPPPPPFLQAMETVDDIDEDEAFINELIALHPNDEDIIVEDIESIEDYASRTAATAESITTANDNSEDNNYDGVRKISFWVFSFPFSSPRLSLDNNDFYITLLYIASRR